MLEDLRREDNVGTACPEGKCLRDAADVGVVRRDGIEPEVLQGIRLEQRVVRLVAGADIQHDVAPAPLEIPLDRPSQGEQQAHVVEVVRLRPGRSPQRVAGP